MMLIDLFTLITVVVNGHVSCFTCTYTRFTRTCELGSSALPMVGTWIINGNVPFKRRKKKQNNYKTYSKCLLYYSIYENGVRGKMFIDQMTLTVGIT